MRRLLLALTAAVLVLAAALWFHTRPGRVQKALAALHEGDDINLVFILIDTLRSDHLSGYGYERPTSPVLDAVARAGIRFAHVRSQSSWTKCSMASLWTGSYPERTGVLRFQHAVAPETLMPAEIIKQAGFRTGGIWRNGWIANNFGFAQGFDAYFRPQPSRVPGRFDRRNPSAHALQGTDLDITESAAQFFQTYADERFFLYLHYMDVHQYLYDESSALFGAEYADAYDNAIHWVDTNVGMIFKALSDLGLRKRTLVVIAADHGEAFFEHGREGHARNLYREVTEVPLIFSLPAPLPNGVVVAPLVQNVDIWPTVLDLLGLPPLPGAQGSSLVPLILRAAGERSVEPEKLEERPAFAQLDRTWGQRKAEPNPLITVTDGRYRLIHLLKRPAADQLFDRLADPDEQKNIARDEPGAVAELRDKVSAYLSNAHAAQAAPREVELDEIRLEQLRALGYRVDARGARPANHDKQKK